MSAVRSPNDKPTCRSCGHSLSHTFADLGMSPLSNAYLAAEALQRMEPFYPLHAYVCDACFLVQLEEFETPQAIFGDYAYFSSYSDSWLEHVRCYAEQMVSRFGFGSTHQVIEVASNDGYLLQNFKAAGIPVLGIEPARNVARVAEEKGIPTLVEFFGTQIAQALTSKGTRADLLIGNNVLAHVPDLNNFVMGLKIILAPDGVITMEFPHLLRLMRGNQFDTIYHEHFSYFSLLAVRRVFAQHGLVVFDVEELTTHGGSLRIFVCHEGSSHDVANERVRALAEAEAAAGLSQIATYAGFAQQVQRTKRDLLSFLIRAKGEGQTIAGYGAPAKGNTLLNYCGIRGDFLDYTVDRSPHKQGKFLPGTHLPIYGPERVAETRPDYLLILPWNIKDEAMAQMAHIRGWGGKFVVPIPSVEVIS